MKKLDVLQMEDFMGLGGPYNGYSTYKGCIEAAYADARIIGLTVVGAFWGGAGAAAVFAGVAAACATP